MSTTVNATAATENNDESKASVVDAVFDAGLAWIDAGLGHLKTAVAASARAMERTANALDAVRERLRP